MVVMGKGPKKGKLKDEEASIYKDTVNLPQTSFGACVQPSRSPGGLRDNTAVSGRAGAFLWCNSTR